MTPLGACASGRVSGGPSDAPAGTQDGVDVAGETEPVDELQDAERCLLIADVATIEDCAARAVEGASRNVGDVPQCAPGVAAQAVQAAWRGAACRLGLLVTGGRGAQIAPALRRELLPHQRVGVRWLYAAAARGGGILGDDPGLGKTLQERAPLQSGALAVAAQAQERSCARVSRAKACQLASCCFVLVRAPRSPLSPGRVYGLCSRRSRT